MAAEQYDLRVLSLGAGVQSSTLYLMAAHGEITPRPAAAIFADTGAEPPWVYRQLDYLEGLCGATIPIHRVTAGNLQDDIVAALRGRRFASVPFFVRGSNGKAAMLRRQCTREYKIDPIRRHIRTLLGLRPRQRAKGQYRVEQWIGISLDEVYRMKPSRYAWIVNRHPLIEQGMRRRDCIRWLRAHWYYVPRKSACIWCPYHDDGFWLWLRDTHPGLFQSTARFDARLRTGRLRGTREQAFVHRSLTPLATAAFRRADDGQQDFGFMEECEGLCGV